MATLTTSAKAAGTISSLSGESRIIGADGMERIAHLGDKVFLRDMILTSSNAVMQLQLEDGQLFDLEADGRYALGNGDGAIWVAQAGSAAGGIVSAPNVIPAGGKPVGTISVVIGDVKIVGVDGVVRVAKVGDAVYMKEVIETGADGIIQIKLADGRTLDVGRDSKLALEADLLAFDPALAAAPPPVADPAAATTDVAALQAQIAAGADPTQVAAATAAGGAPGAGGGLDGSGGDPVVVDQANTSGPVNSGFNSEGAGIQFPTVEPQLLPEIQSTVSVVVEVAVDVPVDPDNPPTDAVFLSPDGPAIVEGTNGENKIVTFVIKLDKPFAVDVEVTYQITPGTAEPGSDYTGVLTATVTIPAGATEVPVPVEIIQDHFVEGNETFNIVLVDAVNATINPAQSTASIIIVDDDRLPVANPDTNWTQEDLSVSASGNVLIDESHPGDPSAELGFADATDVDDEPLTVTTVDGDAANVGVSVVGTYGTLVLNADGSYTYTLDNDLGDVQGLDDGETLTDSFTYTVTDGFNGDSNTTTLTITIFGTNDAPELVIGDPARVSEEGLLAGIPDTEGNADTTNSATFIGQVLVSDVDDEPLTVTLTGPSETLFSNGVEITWSGSGTNALTGSAGGETIITITIDNEGNYTVTLLGQVDHIEDPGEGELSFGVGVHVSDGTATTSDTLMVTIEDDSPVVTQTLLTGTVDEDGLPGGIAGGPNDVADEETMVSGNVSMLFQSGADQPLSYSLSVDTSGLPGLTSGGVAVTYSVVGNLLTASAGGSTVFTFSLNGTTGEYTFTLLAAIDHPTLDSLAGDDTENDVTIALGSIIQATDADGDTVTASGTGLVITVDDDTPVAANDGNLETVTEGTEGFAIGTVAGLLANDEFGADGAAAVDSITIAPGNLGGTVTIDGDGNLIYTAPDLNVDQDPVVETFTYTITDGDGDSTTATFAVTLTDTGIEMGQATDLAADEDDIPAAAGNPGGVNDLENQTLAGTVSYSTGGDDVASVVLSTAGNTTGLQTLSGAAIDTVWVGTQLIGYVSGTDSSKVANQVFTITVTGFDNTGANYTLALLQPVTHLGDNTEDDKTFTVNVLVTDEDGSTGNTSFSVLIDDDTPVAEVESATAAAVLLDESPVAPDGDGIVSATGDFSVNFGTPAFGADGAGSVSYALALTGTDVASGLFVLDPNAVDGKGDEIVLNQSGNIITGSAGSTDYFSIEVDPDTGIVTFTQLANIWHDNASDLDDVETLTLANANLLQLVQTVTDADGDSDEAAINLGTGVFQIEDDGPSIGADNIAIANVAGTYSGTYTFDVGTDVQAFENSFASGSLVWTNPRDGYTLEYDAGASTSAEQVYHGKFNDGADTFFTLTVKSDGTYDFQLMTPDPTTVVEIPSLLAGISGGSNLDEYVFDSVAFNGGFQLVLTGTSEGNPDTLTISSSDLGVGDNVMHGNKDDVLRFDIVPVGGSNSTISTLTIHVATTAGWKATDSVNWTVHYTTGPDQMLTEIWGEDQQVTFNFDENRTVDWVEITPNGNDSFKIDGVSLSYTTQEFPDDYQLNFQLTGSDGDQDIATAEFTIAVNTTDTLTYHIDGTSGNDQVYGTTGNDIIAGGAGDDILTGGAGDDTFRWLSGDKGAGTPAVDAITDWVTGDNKLDLADLLQGENAGNLNVFLMFEQTGSDVTLSVSSQGDGNVDQVIVLQNVTMADLAGANPDTSAGVIANLLDQSKLLIS